MSRYDDPFYYDYDDGPDEAEMEEQRARRKEEQEEELSYSNELGSVGPWSIINQWFIEGDVIY